MSFMMVTDLVPVARSLTESTVKSRSIVGPLALCTKVTWIPVTTYPSDLALERSMPRPTAPFPVSDFKVVSHDSRNTSLTQGRINIRFIFTSRSNVYNDA